MMYFYDDYTLWAFPFEPQYQFLLERLQRVVVQFLLNSVFGLWA